MPQQLLLKTASVVALGVFDVRSFTPTALLKNGILPQAEAIAAESLTVIPSKVVTFESGSLKISAEQNRVQVERLAPPYIQAADILSKAVRDNAEYPSKMTAIGINAHAYWMLDNFDVRDRLGRQLAPINTWGRWSEDLSRAAEFGPRHPRHPGMVSITMRLPNTEDRKAGWIDVRVAPSYRDVNVPEIVIAINDHYALPDDGNESDPLALLAIAETRFDSSIKRADDIAASILEQAK